MDELAVLFFVLLFMSECCAILLSYLCLFLTLLSLTFIYLGFLLIQISTTKDDDFNCCSRHCPQQVISFNAMSFWIIALIRIEYFDGLSFHC